jgi:hypothetical protein
VERRKRRQGKFPGLQLSATDRGGLRAARRGGRRFSERRWRRIRILERLDRGWKLSQTATAVGTYPREVRRVGWRYLELGLEAALTDDPRPKPPKLLDATQQAAIVAMVCGPPPPGQARWTVVLTAAEAQQRGVVGKGGTGGHPPSVCKPRPEAVAGKKCGACRSSTKSTCNGWKRYWKC